ncbi:MAG TPA: type II toxin-antitoxin system VapC family toxin [Micromonosporaceae bacterium]|nr:type II toxin-antitoxin system VapC family toxin [Micromonosporaceae bacterium]
MIYLDSAAVMKLVRLETGDPCLGLAECAPRRALVSSTLVEVEVPHALRRAAPQALVGVPSALARLYRLEIDATVRATAATFAEPTLRTLDAVHLATAQLLVAEAGAAFEAFVSHDKRLLAAASAVGLPTECPGA